MDAEERKMIRLFAATVLFALAAVPVFACDREQSVSTDAQPNIIAAQPASDDATAPPGKPAATRTAPAKS